MEKITPFLWFDGKAEEAAKFYVSIFKNSKVTSVTRLGAAEPGRKGAAMSVTFHLDGQDFMALNGGPHFTFSPALSFYVNCKTQKEGNGEAANGGLPLASCPVPEGRGRGAERWRAPTRRLPLQPCSRPGSKLRFRPRRGNHSA